MMTTNQPTTATEAAAPGTTRFRRVGNTFRALEQRDFRYLWLSMVLQSAGQNMQTLAMGYLAYDLTGSETALGAVVAALGLPGLLLSLFGGAIGDRMDKKSILQSCQVLLALLGLLVALSVTFGIVNWYLLIVASFAYGAVMAFFWPVRQALIPQTVRRDLVMNAMALNSSAMSTMTILGPGLGGVLIGLFGTEVLFYLLAVLHLTAALLIMPLPTQAPDDGKPKRSILQEIGDGFTYVRSSSLIMLLLFLGFAQMTLMVPIRYVMPVFAKDVFQTGPEGLGLMMSGLGLGSLGGSLVVASLEKAGRRGLVLGVTGVLSGALILVFCLVGYLAPVLLLAVPVLLLMGLIQSGRMAMQNSLLVEYVDQSYRGRVMSLYAVSWSAMPVAVLPLTALMDGVGAPLGMGGLALAFVVISLLTLALSPRLRSLA